MRLLTIAACLLLTMTANADADKLRQVAMNTGGDPKRGKAIFYFRRRPVRHLPQGPRTGRRRRPGPVADRRQVRPHPPDRIDPRPVRGNPPGLSRHGHRDQIRPVVHRHRQIGIRHGRHAAWTRRASTAPSRATTIESRAVSKVSLMPTGLADDLTPAEFTDLIAYLASLAHRAGPDAGGRGRRPADAAAGVHAPRWWPTGLTGATAMEVAPDGRVFVCEQTGALARRQEWPAAAEAVREAAGRFDLGARPDRRDGRPGLSEDAARLRLLRRRQAVPASRRQPLHGRRRRGRAGQRDDPARRRRPDEAGRRRPGRATRAGRSTSARTASSTSPSATRRPASRRRS